MKKYAAYLVALLYLSTVHAADDKDVPRSRNSRSVDFSSAKARLNDTRLPTDVTPNSYKIQLQPYLEDGNFNGEVWINVNCSKPTSSVTLNIRHLVIEEPEVMVVDVLTRSVFQVVRHEYDLTKERYVLHLDSELQQGSVYDINIHFSGVLSDENKGFYRSNYVDQQTGDKRWFAATNLKADNARQVFPCFDEPSLKAEFQVSIIREDGLTALSNMELESSGPTPDDSGLVLDKFKMSPPMATYLVAFLVSDLEYRDTNLSTYKIRVFARSDMIDQVEYATKFAPRVFNFFMQYLKRPFPLSKLDLVALPGLKGTDAENWGLIFLSEGHLLNDGKSSTREWIMSSIITEISYQYFGNLVSPNWWSDVWINRVLNTYLSSAATEEVVPYNEMSPYKLVGLVAYSLYYEYSKYTPYGRVRSLKDTISASKGALVVRMLNNSLTEDTFRDGLKSLLDAKEYKTFVEDDLWNALTEEGHMQGTLPDDCDVKTIAESWTSKDRFPVVTVIRNYENSSATASQKVFLRDRVKDIPNKESLLWWIPLIYTSQDDLDFNTRNTAAWMKGEREISLIDLPPSDRWVILNFEEIGFFFVNYDPENWRMLSEYLDSAKRTTIPPVTRAKLLHDALNLAYGDELDFGVAFDVSRFLSREREYEPWRPAFNMFDHLGRQIDGTSAWNKFREYILSLVAPLHEELINLDMTNEPEWRSKLRSNAWSELCDQGYEQCVTRNRDVYKRWMDMEDPDVGIPIPSNVFCPVFEWGTREEWEFGLERVMHLPTNTPHRDRGYLLKTLAGCPRDPWAVNRILNVTLLENSPKFNDGDYRLIFSMLTGGATGYTVLFDFLDANWDHLAEKFKGSPSTWNSLISAATGVFKTTEGLNKVRALYDEHKGKFRSAETTIQQSMKKIEAEAIWSDKNIPAVEAWLESYLAERQM